MDEFAEKTVAGGPVIIAITGMKCAGCVGAVKRVLARVAGVSGVEIDLDAGRAMVAGTAHPRDLVAAVQGAGYGAHS